MKIALSMQNGRDLSGHAGRCTGFLVYTIENDTIQSKKLVEIDMDMTFHSIFHDGVYSFSQSPLHDIKCIISGSMGLGFVQKMKSNGIEALQTDEQNPDSLIEKYIRGDLVLTTPINHHHH